MITDKQRLNAIDIRANIRNIREKYEELKTNTKNKNLQIQCQHWINECDDIEYWCLSMIAQYQFDHARSALDIPVPVLI